jgi:hypothetical protein
MTDQGDIVVRKLTSADVHTTAEVLARAFADNPAYVWMHPRAATRRERAICAPSSSETCAGTCHSI